jgi:hypothetical protein
MTRNEAVDLIADALEGRAVTTGDIPGLLGRSRRSFVRQADRLLARTEDREPIGPSADIRWFQEQARLAKDDPTKKWWTVLDMGRALALAPATAARHVTNAATKNHVIRKSGPKVGRGAADHYRWNDSDTNPLWAAQQKQDDAVQDEPFDF